MIEFIGSVLSDIVFIRLVHNNLMLIFTVLGMQLEVLLIHVFIILVACILVAHLHMRVGIVLVLPQIRVQETVKFLSVSI